MISLRTECKTGVFEVDASGVRTSMFMMDGALVYAEDTPAGEALGRLLVRMGTLTKEQYTLVIQAMADALVGDPAQLLFGNVAVEHGFITDEQLSQGLFDQVRWRIIGTFHREDHEWAFKEGRERVDGVPLFDLTLEPLVILAVRTMPEEDRSDILPAASMRRYATLADDPEAIAQRFELRPGERAFIERIDGSTRLSDLIPDSATPQVRNHQAAILAALLWTRAAKLADLPRVPISVKMLAAPPVAAPPVAAPPVAAAPVVAAPDATSNAVLSFELPELAPPSRPAAAPAAPAAPAATEARPPDSTRRVPGAAPTKVTHEARLNAELAFQKGKTHFRSDRADEALGEFRRAHELDPHSSEFELYMRWLECGACEKKVDAAAALALKRAALATNKNQPNLAFPIFVIGRLTLLEGHETDAVRWFERALKIEPDMREADRALRTLKAVVKAPGQAGGGLLGRVSGWLGRDKPPKPDKPPT